LSRTLVALLLTAPAAAFAQQADEDVIVVTGTGLAQAPGDPAYGSVTIERERLTNEASGRIENVLADVAGFQQFRRSDSRSANPSAQGATLRGIGGNASSRALVLLDGIPQADPFFGYIPFSALDPGRLSAARVTRGGGAGAFGAGAVAGTVELFSAGPGDLPGLSASALYGSRDSTELSASASGRLGGGFASVSGRWDRGDGFYTTPARQRTPLDVPAAYDSWSAALRGVAPISGDFELQARGLVFEDHRTLRFADADSSSSGADASIRLVGRGSWGVEALAYVQMRNFTNKTVSAATGRVVLDQHNTPSTGLGGKIELRPPVGGGHVLRVGVDVRRSSGTLYENNYNASTGARTAMRTAGGKVTTAGAFIEDSWTAGSLTLTGGARIDRWAIADGFLREITVPSMAFAQNLRFADRDGWRGSGRAGAIVRASHGLDLRAAAYTGFRVPTLNELYRPFRVFPDATAANAALRLEKLNGAEAGFDLRPAEGVQLGVTAFWNELKDAVANVTVARGPGNFPQVGFVAAGGAFRQRHNVDAVRAYGLEVTGAVAAGDFDLSGSFALNDSRVRASGAAAALDGKRPAQSPRYAGSATLAWRPVQGARLSTTLRYVGAQFEDDLETQKLPEAITLDAVASVSIRKGIELVARAENIFDEEVVTRIAGGTLDLGTPRTLWLGLKFER